MSSRRIRIVVRLAVFVAALLAVCMFQVLQPSKVTVFQFSKMGNTVTDTYFISRTTDIAMAAPSDVKVYYTTDGSTPDENSAQYTEPLVLNPWKEEMPNCLLLKAFAVYADGTKSEVLTHTFLAHTQIESHHHALILSISGEPSQLTEEPGGILFGQNAFLRGPGSEREIYIEAISAGGMRVFQQGAGVRVYGGASRQSIIKSLKIFARKEYDNKTKFSIDLFGTLGADNQIIDQYDRLVIRNSANDLYHGYIRDELNQRLAAQAGYTDYQEVVPATVFLNGVYYGYFWLHENYCDAFLKDKYGGEKGHFEILESAETFRTVDETDPENAAAAKEYNEIYNQLVNTDLTLDENYAKVCSFMDVESFLQNYAFNIYINNTDWPHNNNKCYRYYAAEGESYQEGHLDGRWRFLYHDLDYTLGIYAQDRSSASRNNLQELMTPGHGRYSPMFTKLMARADCRNYFISEIIRLKEGVLSAENIIKTLGAMDADRATELRRWFVANIAGADQAVEEHGIYKNYRKSLDLICKFAAERESYMESHLISQFGLPQDYFHAK